MRPTTKLAAVDEEAPSVLRELPSWLLTQSETLVRAAQDTIFAPLTPPERTQLTALLTKVLTHHDG